MCADDECDISSKVRPNTEREAAEALDRSIKGTESTEREAVLVPSEFVAAAEAILAAPPDPRNVITKHKAETGYSVYESWARRTATRLLALEAALATPKGEE